jgi:hypothetical protein
MRQTSGMGKKIHIMCPQVIIEPLPTIVRRD